MRKKGLLKQYLKLRMIRKSVLHFSHFMEVSCTLHKLRQKMRACNYLNWKSCIMCYDMHHIHDMNHHAFPLATHVKWLLRVLCIHRVAVYARVNIDRVQVVGQIVYINICLFSCFKNILKYFILLLFSHNFISFQYISK